MQSALLVWQQGKEPTARTRVMNKAGADGMVVRSVLRDARHGINVPERVKCSALVGVAALRLARQSPWHVAGAATIIILPGV